jgi:hypothetical protein
MVIDSVSEIGGEVVVSSLVSAKPTKAVIV